MMRLVRAGGRPWNHYPGREDRKNRRRENLRLQPGTSGRSI